MDLDVDVDVDMVDMDVISSESMFCWSGWYLDFLGDAVRLRLPDSGRESAVYQTSAIFPTVVEDRWDSASDADIAVYEPRFAFTELRFSSTTEDRAEL